MRRFGPFVVAGVLALASSRQAPAQGFLVFELSAPGQSLGWAVAAAGDFDGDAIPDAILGGPYSMPGSTLQGGEVRVFSGSTGSLLFSLLGTGYSEGLGGSVSGAGDVDGDDLDDVLVGAELADLAASAWTNFGYARLLAGGSGTLLFQWAGSAQNTQMGRSVAGGVDVDFDGIPDALVGALGSPPGGFPFVTAFSGANGAPIYTVSGSAAGFGRALAFVGDLDGDGIDEFAVGAPDASPIGLPQSGQARVFSGANGLPLFLWSGPAWGDRFGASVAPAGDVDQNSVPDVAVGAPQSSGPTGVGWIRVFSGVNGTPLLTATGSGTGGQFGQAVAGLGDVAGDGVPDLLVGAPGGWAPSPSPGYAQVVSGATGGGLLTIAGNHPTGWFGWAVAAMGDVTGDGITELLIGAPWEPTGTPPDKGVVRVFSIAGIPSGSSLYSGGCPGSSGVVPRIQTAGGAPDPSAGNPGFVLVLSQALPGAPALILAGVSDTFWNALGLPLPANLGFAGFPACSLLASGEVLVPSSTTAGGLLFAPFPVPANPILLGGSVYFQGFIFDPPGAMTQGLEIVL